MDLNVYIVSYVNSILKVSETIEHITSYKNVNEYDGHLFFSSFTVKDTESNARMIQQTCY